MITSIYLHQFNRNYREKSYAEFARTAKEYGIDQVWFKAWQGGSLAVWDKSALGLSTYDRIAKCFDECASEGVEAVFWGVPQGNTWRQDAAVCHAIGARNGGKAHIDLEGFADFWNTPKFGSTGMPPFFQMLKDADLWVDTSAVMRFGEPESFPWEELIDLTDTVWTQSYFSTFKQSAVNVVRDDLNTALALGIPVEKLGVILPHDGSRPELDSGWEVARTMGVNRVSIWVWDWAGITPFEFLRDVNGTTPEPNPFLERDALWLELVEVGAEVEASAQTLQRISAPGDTSITEEAAIGETYRIAGLWQGYATKATDLALRLKG